MTWIVLARSGEISWVGQPLAWVRRPSHYITSLQHIYRQTSSGLYSLFFLSCRRLPRSLPGWVSEPWLCDEEGAGEKWTVVGSRNTKGGTANNCHQQHQQQQ